MSGTVVERTRWARVIGGVAVLCAVLGGVARAEVGGWDYLIDKLVADGVPRDRVVRTFGDPRMPAFDGLPFGLDPREPTARYRNFRTEAAAKAARRCYYEHAEVLRSAEEQHGVPGSVVAAIMYVETGCGRNVGSSRILHRLARLAMANEPANLRWNIERHGADEVTAERVRARGRYLEDTFYPEVLATFGVADRLQCDPLELRGSGSGAFGNPQFLPTSYLKHGRDADGDGHVDLFSTPDAAASCARYLASFGWTPRSTDAEKRRVIWHYNRSDAYVDTVLLLANRIENPDYQMATPKPAPKKVAAKRSTKRTAGKKASTRAASTKKASSKKASTKKASTKKAPAKKATSTKAASKSTGTSKQSSATARKAATSSKKTASTAQR